MASKQSSNRVAYDRIYVTVPKGDKDKIKMHASAFGDSGSVNAFINRTIVETMERDERRRAKIRQEIIDSCPDVDDIGVSMLVNEREQLQRAMRERLRHLEGFKKRIQEKKQEKERE